MFGHADVSAEIIDDADGSGYELIKILKKRAADATDEDHALSSGADPYANQFDLSDDPIAYYWDRMALAQQLLQQASSPDLP